MSELEEYEQIHSVRYSTGGADWHWAVGSKVQDLIISRIEIRDFFERMSVVIYCQRRDGSEHVWKRVPFGKNETQEITYEIRS